MSKVPVALTMYTVRKDAAEDYLGTFRKVAEMGYKGIQTHYKAAQAGDLRRLADSLGVAIVGVHTGLQPLRDELEGVVDFNLSLGCKDVTCPWLPDEYRTADGLREAGRILNEIGAEITRRGLRLTYHNHAFEFEKYGGIYGYDILFNSLDLANVKAELDVYWLKFGGQDPVEYINRFAGNLPLLHIKDMEPGDQRFYAEIGEGIIDWPEVFAAAEKAGVEWAIVEQDECRRLPMESARLSLENLKKMGLA